MSTMEKAYFASGCFWGAERKLWMTPGVTSMSVGYMEGNTKNPFGYDCHSSTGIPYPTKKVAL